VFHSMRKAIFTLLLLLCSNGVYASYSESELAQRIEDIQKLSDDGLALKKIIKLSEEQSLSPKQRIAVLKSSISLYRRNDDSAGAIVATQKRIAIAQEFEFEIEYADAQKTLGIFYYLSAKNSQALLAYQKALNIYLPLDFPLITASLHNNIGLAHAAIDNVSEAMESYQKATKLYNIHGSAADRIDIYFNIAGFYTRIKQFDIAIEMLRKVIAERKEINDHNGVALAYGDLGNAYKSANNYRQAKFYYEKALRYFEQTDQNYNIASQSHNVSGVYALMGKFEPAEYYANRAITLGQSTQNTYAHVGGLHSLATLKFQQKSYDIALKYIDRSLALASEFDIPERIQQGLGLKALIHAAQSKPVEAMRDHRRYVELNTIEHNAQLEAQLFKYREKQQSTAMQQALEKKTFDDNVTQLRMQADNQQMIMTFLVSAVSLLAAFFLYRRRIVVQLKNELEQQVAQRTEELEQLTVQLQQASVVKSQFMANMSHEIRTPLTSIIGHAQSIVQGEVDAYEQRREVEVILANSIHVLTILNDIIDLSRIEVNKLEISYQTYDIHVIIDEIKQLFSEQINKKGLQFSVKYHMPMPQLVRVDRTRLKQIFINLCSNAIKFTHHGLIAIDVMIDGDNLLFKVTDTGIGIKDQQLEEIFNSFSQADNSISRRFGGFGLGLCLSQELAQMMGGHISVISTINEGSEFTLTLPCIEKELKVLPEPEAITEMIPQLELHGIVLLAEDHGDNRRLIARLLTAMGLEVLQAKNGIEAISICNSQHVDLILMDIQMPELDGIGAFKTLREEGYELPIIALTANAMPHEVDSYIELGFDDFLAKPIERKRFVATVAHYLKQALVPSAQNSLAKVDMSDLADDFIVSLASEYEKLSLLIAQRDYQNIAKLTHRLSGAASMFGYNTMAALGGDIETKIALAQFEDADKLLKMLRAMISRTAMER